MCYNTGIGNLNMMVKYLGDKKAMGHVSRGFPLHIKRIYWCSLNLNFTCGATLLVT